MLENDDDGGGEGEFEGFPFGDEEEMFNLFNMMMADMLFGIGGKRGGKASFMSASMSGSQYFEEHVSSPTYSIESIYTRVYSPCGSAVNKHVISMAGLV